MRLTNWGEAAAFLLARILTLGLMFVVYPVFLATLYLQLVRQGGVNLVMIVSEGISVVVWLVTLVLFLLFRAGFGAVPTIVAPPDRRAAFTSSGGEIGAYLLSIVVVLAALWGVNKWVLPGIYASLRTSGHLAQIGAISLAISVTASAVFFLLFVALRALMAERSSSQASW